MADPVRPRWRCAEPGCRASEGWQPVPGAAGAGDLGQAERALDAHYARAHPELEEEVVGRAELCTT